MPDICPAVPNPMRFLTPAGYTPNWLSLEGLVNFRCLSDIPALDEQGNPAKIRPGRLYRCDNLQTLTNESAEKFVNHYGVSDVIDLRSSREHRFSEPTLIESGGLAITHKLTLFSETSPQNALPKLPRSTADSEPKNSTDGYDYQVVWGGHWGEDQEENLRIQVDFLANYYQQFLEQRPENVLSALKIIANAPGAVAVHCAAGKDRTGVIIALALAIAGVEREYIAADYQASSEKVPLIMEKMRGQRAYQHEVGEYWSPDRQRTPGAAMLQFFVELESRYSSLDNYLRLIGWQESDTAKLRVKLCRPQSN